MKRDQQSATELTLFYMVRKINVYNFSARGALQSSMVKILLGVDMIQVGLPIHDEWTCALLSLGQVHFHF